MRKLTLNEQSALNVLGSILLVAINIVINLVLSPYIVVSLGVEANGYITLANNFVSYMALVTIALNSMAGRFILVSHRNGDLKSANEYYSSVLLGDWILAGVFIVPAIIFVLCIDDFINVSIEFLCDTKLLFLIVFFNYLVHLCIPQWRTATYCTNNLYLRSLNSAFSAIVRAVVIYFSFALFTAHSYYVAIAASSMTVVSITIDYMCYRKLMPELKWKVSYFQISKVKELVFSGIWNTVSQCGNLLLEGLDILVANVFINPIASGVLALSKVIPNMINQITGTVATTYGPRLTYLYVEGKKEEMIEETKNNITIISFLSNIPIGLFWIYGIDFFKCWLPSQDSLQLTILSSVSLFGMLFLGLSQCYVNIFGVVNKLRLNSLVVIASGLLNIFIVVILLKNTDLGIYSIVCASSLISIARVFLFVAPYAAKCINASSNLFRMLLLKGSLPVLIPCVIGFIVKSTFAINGWFTLILSMALTGLLVVAVNFYLVINSAQRTVILKILHVKK